MADIFTIDRDPLTGVETRIGFEDDVMVTQESMPGRSVQKILDHAHRMRETHMPTRSFGGYAGTVPNQLRHEWRKEWKRHCTAGGSLDWKEYLVMKMNSPDYKLLRTQDKRL